MLVVPEYLTRRNGIIAAIVGPAVTFTSIALGVLDHGFDSIAGVLGYVLITLISALASLLFFVLGVTGTRTLLSWWQRRRGRQVPRLGYRVAIAAAMALFYWFVFHLPTVRIQLFAMMAVTFLLALLLLRPSGPKRRALRSDAQAG